MDLTREQVLAYVRANGMPPHAPNFTITKDGSHPRVKGNGILVPYSMVFDHAGRLVYDHMSGSYHGGDGWTMVEWVDKQLAEVPAVWVGEAPYERVEALARQIAKGKGLPALVKKLEDQRAASPEPDLAAELDRLHASVARHRDRVVRRALAAAGSAPGEVLPAVRELAKDLKGTGLGADVDARIAELEGSSELEAAVEMEKQFTKVTKAFLRLKDKQRTQGAVAKVIEKLEALLPGHESLPYAAVVEAFLANLR